MATIKPSWNDGVNEWLRQLNPDSISSSRVAAMLPFVLKISSLKVRMLSGGSSSKSPPVKSHLGKSPPKQNALDTKKNQQQFAPCDKMPPVTN